MVSFFKIRYNYVMANNKLLGKNAIVIGGTSSIGLSVSKLLSKNGINVTAIGRTIPDQTQETKAISFISLDLEETINSLNGNTNIEENKIFALTKKADILINCYGPFLQKSFHETTPQDWYKISLSDYALPGILISTALPHMMEHNFGRIVLFGGTRTESVKAYKTNAAYAGAKTGTAVLVKSVASQYESFGITCNQIMPGFTRNCPPTTTPVSNEMLAEKVYFLISNPELNGVLLNVDRGWNP